MKPQLLAALAVTLLTATPALAQTGQDTPTSVSPAVTAAGQWTVTPLLSFTFGGDGDTTSLGLGGAVSYAFTDALEAEGELAYVFDLIGDDDAADWSVLSVSGNAVYNFPLANGWSSYATAGLTFARSNRQVSDTVADTGEFGFNFGGGLKVPLRDNLAARGDLRYFKYNDAGPGGFRLYGGLTWKLSL
jgi:opacity protein-like surface antigen